MITHGANPSTTPSADRYASTRRPDPRIVAQIHAACLATRARVLNVGAGAGSYEPTDRAVVAVEPSAVMLVQRRPTRIPRCRPLARHSPSRRPFDAAMARADAAPLDRPTRWDRRGTTGCVAPRGAHLRHGCAPWFASDYLPAMIGQDAFVFPPVRRGRLVARRRRRGRTRAPRLHRRVRRRVLGAARAVPRPATARAGMSVVRKLTRRWWTGMRRLRDDLASRAWTRGRGHLRELPENRPGVPAARVALGSRGSS